MSKKIKLILSDKNKPDLSSLFRDYIKNRKALPRRRRNLGCGIIVDEDDAEYADILSYWDSQFPGWDDDPPMEDDECDVVFPTKGKRDPYTEFWDKDSRSSKKGKKKHKRHGKSSKAKLVDIHKPYDGFIDDEIDYEPYYENNDLNPSGCRIFFYNDYHDKSDAIIFTSLMEFDEFCERNGYFVPGYVQDDLMYRSESHCCLMPLAEQRGVLEIMSESSWGELFYEACDESELGGM